jgi:hypothetical protein
MAMMAMTTSSSIKVNARRVVRGVMVSRECGRVVVRADCIGGGGKASG